MKIKGYNKNYQEILNQLFKDAEKNIDLDKDEQSRWNKQHHIEKVMKFLNFENYNEIDWNNCINAHLLDQLTVYTMKEWLCTDTIVGLYLFKINNNEIGFSEQLGRKSDLQFYFKSQSMFDYLLRYMHGFVLKNPSKNFFTYEDWINFNQKNDKSQEETLIKLIKEHGYTPQQLNVEIIEE